MDRPTVRKYRNRRLYDAEQKRCITLAELAVKITGGADVRVVDAKSGTDLTQATLMQILLERRNAAQLLPEKHMLQLIRLPDRLLEGFLDRAVGEALARFSQSPPLGGEDADCPSPSKA